MTDFNSFFDAKPVVQEQQQMQITEFRPNPKKGQNGLYQAIVRFLPNPVDPSNKSIISKYCVYLTNPATQTSKSVDCPSTVGQPDPIQNTFFALRNSSNPVLQENAKKFSRKQQFAALVQVLDCKSDPSLVNKILVWKFGAKIHDKLLAEMNPPMGEPKNPFNLFTGRPFNVQVKEVGGFPNYDSCGFFDLALAQSGMRVVDGRNTYVVTTDTIATEQGKAMVFNYLKDNAPSTDKYEYHDWDAETTTFVNQCIQLYSDPNATLQALSASQNPGVATVQQQPAVQQAAMQPQVSNTQPFTMPSMGLGAQQAAPTTPGGFQAPQLGADVDALLNTTPQSDKKQAPSMGLDLSDVLNGQML